MSNFRPSKAEKRAHKRYLQRYQQVAEAFDADALKQICEMRELDFTMFGMGMVEVENYGRPGDFYLFRDNDSDVLSVAHLDTVVDHEERMCGFLETAAGPVVYSGALDDRLGAYILLDLLPKLGVNHDLLLTVGEEQGCSTAAHFAPPKDYNWMIEFDRGGTDVVMYEYEDDETVDLVRACGARVGQGSFSDICYLDHLAIKGFNWGVGYQDYHGPRSHAYLEDTFSMVARYLTFHETNAHVALPHEDRWHRTPWAQDEERSWLDDYYRATNRWAQEGEPDFFGDEIQKLN